VITGWVITGWDCVALGTGGVPPAGALGSGGRVGLLDALFCAGALFA